MEPAVEYARDRARESVSMIRRYLVYVEQYAHTMLTALEVDSIEDLHPGALVDMFEDIREDVGKVEAAMAVWVCMTEVTSHAR